MFGSCYSDEIYSYSNYLIHNNSPQNNLNEIQSNSNNSRSEINSMNGDVCNNNIFSINNRDNQPFIEDYNPVHISDDLGISPYINKCPDEKCVINVKEEKQIFTKSEEGLDKFLKKIELVPNYKSSNNINKIKNYSVRLTKFKTNIYNNGKKIRKKKKRRCKPDLIKKRIKAKFHKDLKNIINRELKKAGSIKLFDYLPQCFTANITRKLNNKAFKLTYEQLIEDKEVNKIKTKIDKAKYDKNIEVLNYLKANPKICKDSKFDIIKNMKYIDILKEYFKSKEFEQSVIELYNKKENIKYIEDYVNKALTYVQYFASNKIFNDDNKISYITEEEECQDNGNESN